MVIVTLIKNNEEMVEYHVDASHIFQDRMNKETQFEGKLSVRLEEATRALLMFGHDESIFKQYLPKRHGRGPMEKLHWYLKMIARELCLVLSNPENLDLD